MNKELRIELLEKRAAVLASNGRENGRVIAKIRRQIRNLKKSIDAE
jgi:hypothetical protein